MRRYLPAIVGLSLVIVVSVVQGFWTDRWGVSKKVQDAADSLKKVPAEFGDWVSETLTPRGNDDQGLAGRLYRRYTNRKTGEVISIALVCGRPGRAAIHTPDVCYGASGFRVGKRVEFELKNSRIGGPAPHFYTADMTHTTPTEESKQRLYWTWRADGRWQIADDPRLTFASRPVLFKLYVARDVVAVPPVDQDPCVEFLRQFLPQLEKVLDDGAV
jgi:hypothetical protein